MRKIVILVCLSGLCLPSVVVAQQIKVGYVDLVRALAECNAGKQAQKQIQTEISRKEQGLQQQKKKVEQLKNELEKKALLLREEERESLERDYRQSLRDFERRYKDSEEDLKIRDRNLAGKILVELHQIVAELGEQGKYTLILEGNNTVVLYGQKSIDLTDQVIAEHNKKGGAKVSRARGRVRTTAKK